MDNVFEALERIKNKFIDFFHEDVPDFDVLEQALTELKQIKDAKPSKAMKCLERIDKKDYITEREHKEFYNVVKETLLKTKELEKENTELLQAVAFLKQKLDDINDIKVATTMMKQLDRNVSLEKEIAKYKKVIDIIWNLPTQSKVVMTYLKENMNSTYDDYCLAILDEYRTNKENFETLKWWSKR